MYLKISTKWHGSEIKQIVTGIRKRNLRFTGGPSRVESLLTSALIHKVVSTADSLRIQNGFQELCVIAWWFLLRVSNEGIPLQVGHITVLNSQLYVIRVFGSKILSFTFVCVDVKTGPRVLFCPDPVCVRSSVHTCVHHTDWLLFSFNVLLGNYSFSSPRERSRPHFGGSCKAFRAGRASEMAAQGDTLGAILLAGEWSSSAVLRYVNVDAIEEQLFLQRAVLSDSDGE